ncbi:MAG: hypothetical protein IPH50_08960 [Rhodanobacteraceae bacterium]|nr:hypothetical protein [Rhodanobacteraceae bacterium]
MLFAEVPRPASDGNCRARDVQPTVWADACEELRPMYGQAVAGEALWLIATASKLKDRGCTIDDAVNGKPGLRIHCADPAAHSACRSAFHPNADKYCRLSEPPLRADRSLAGRCGVRRADGRERAGGRRGCG